jgi:hypothetical protein
VLDNPPLHCAHCGYRTNPSGPRGLQRVLVVVADEAGARRLCDLCVMALIADLGPSGDVTLFVASRQPVAG